MENRPSVQSILNNDYEKAKLEWDDFATMNEVCQNPNLRMAVSNYVAGLQMPPGKKPAYFCQKVFTLNFRYHIVPFK